MQTTITLEFTTETHEHLAELEYQLKQIHGLQVLFVPPKHKAAPTLISLGIGGKGEHANLAIRRIAHTLYDFLHRADGPSEKITMVTIKGENIDITPLAADQIRQIVADAYANQ